MKVLRIDNVQQAEEELRKVKAEGINKMVPKTVFRVVKIDSVPQEKANIMKEEMLKAGGDVAISVDAWNKKNVSTDVLIFGTLKQYEDFFDGIDSKGMLNISSQIKNLIVY